MRQKSAGERRLHMLAFGLLLRRTEPAVVGFLFTNQDASPWMGSRSRTPSHLA